MKRRIFGALLVLLLSPLVGPAPAAEAIGGAACVISGTISFSPPSGASGKGAWSIAPAAINCHGLFNGVDRFLGQGPFRGSGSYTANPTGTGACLHHVGSGIVEYMIPTTATDLHVRESHEFIMAGAGKFATPTLRGSFLVTPPFEGDCLTEPVTRATFFAQAVMPPRTTR